MSEDGRSELTASGESDGLISGTFPAADSLLVEIFEGCCCVANCSEGEKEDQKEAGTMAGMPCCPQTNSPPASSAGSDNVQQAPPEYAGMCEQIKLQLSLIGGPYFKFALAFEPILDIPPGPPNIPGLDIGLFGVDMDIKLPPIPIIPEIPGIPSIPLGLELPNLDPPGFFFAPDFDPFPGMPLMDMSIKPISLGLDLFKLKLPEIPDFDPCAIAKFKGLIKPDAECDSGIPPIGINIVICWMCMLLFFLFIIMPILIILLGMKEKGLLTEDAEGNIDFGSSDEPKIAAPPRISIIHSRSEQTLDNLMTFEMSDSGVTRVIFTITGFELNKLYPGKFIHQDGEDIVEQIEPSVSHEGKVSSTSSASYKWTVHAPDNSIKEKSNENPSPEDYSAAFNSFKDSLIKPKSLEERKIFEINKGSLNADPQSSDRNLIYNFTSEGLYEVYCEVKIAGEEKTKIMAAYVQVGKPEKVVELPPILKALPRFPAAINTDLAAKASTVPQQQEREEIISAKKSQPESTPVIKSDKKGI